MFVLLTSKLCLDAILIALEA